VHRDLYIDPELFRLEQEHFFANTWNYVGHDSQIPRPATGSAPRSPASR
jgi:phenylpropionate dioxygenase-like ring-hydroxylating dioxygenase large terminal subunit